MSKRTHFVTVTALPAGISRETVLNTLHTHTEMIDLNPLVIERHPIKPPQHASPEESQAQWYSITDKIQYIPGVYKGELSFTGCFHDLPNGLQTHVYAPMGLDMQGKWTLGGSLPGEPREAVEMGQGIPKVGLWLKEEVDMKCNFTMTSFVKSKTKKAHTSLVERMIEKSHVKEGEQYNNALKEQMDLRSQYPPDYHTSQSSHSGMSSPVGSGFGDHKPPLTQQPSVMSHVSRDSSVIADSKRPHSLQDPGMAVPGMAPLPGTVSRGSSYHEVKPGPGYPSEKAGYGYPNDKPGPGYPNDASMMGMGQPYPHQYPQPPYPQQYPGYPPYPPQMAPTQQFQNYPPMQMPGPPGPYPHAGGAHPMHFSAELPSENTKSPTGGPIEIGSSPSPAPPRQ